VPLETVQASPARILTSQRMLALGQFYWVKLAFLARAESSAKVCCFPSHF
jgi:hypothetical protein